MELTKEFVMKKLISSLILATIASQTVAAPKRLLCTDSANNGKYDVSFTVEAILETDDFAKESPEAEVTVLSWKVDGEESLGVTGYFTAATGKTYRMPYSVTPTTLSITARTLIETSEYGSHLKKIDISRKDLTIKGGSCTIEDYATNNAI